MRTRPKAMCVTDGPEALFKAATEPTNQHHSHKQTSNARLRTKRDKQYRQGQEMHPAGATNP